MNITHTPWGSQKNPFLTVPKPFHVKKELTPFSNANDDDDEDLNLRHPVSSVIKTDEVINGRDGYCSNPQMHGDRSNTPRPIERYNIGNYQASQQPMIEEEQPLSNEAIVTIAGIPPIFWDGMKLELEVVCGRIAAYVKICYGVYAIRFESKAAAQKCLWLSSSEIANMGLHIKVVTGAPPSLISALRIKANDINLLQRQDWPIQKRKPKLRHTWR